MGEGREHAREEDEDSKGDSRFLLQLMKPDIAAGWHWPCWWPSSLCSKTLLTKVPPESDVLHFPQRELPSTSKMSVLEIKVVAHHAVTDELSFRLNSILHELLMIIQASSSSLCPHPVSYQISICLFLWK